jgi:Notch-like protein
LWVALAQAASVAGCAEGGHAPDGDGIHHMPNEGLPVGSPCTKDLDCDSPTTPDCLSEVKPLKSLAGVPAELADLGLVFPDGYCSSVLDCMSDADCGDRGTCYLPFREVKAETLRELEPSLKVSKGSLDFLPALGLCMRRCTTASECEVGQLCEPPLKDFVSLVPGNINDVSFCVPDPACKTGDCTSGPCSPNPCMNGGTCAATGTTYECTCVEGYAGVNCETQTTVPDREIGQSCTSSAQCNVRGTPVCLTELHPLEDVLPPTEFLAKVGLDFAHGYCSNQPHCASHIECGPHGKCLAPFRDVTEQTFRDLEMTFDPPLAPGALDFLGGYGVCLRSCVDVFECFADQACELVMPEFISQVPGSVNSQTYCVPHEDCQFCNSHAHCVVDSEGHGACVCNAGYTGNGLTCAATGQGACAASPCENGGKCTGGENDAYSCECLPGYSGRNCQIAAACTPDPCENGGTCTPTGASTFECACPVGYSGPTCAVVTTCPTLSRPIHGDVGVSSVLPDGTATYECDTGFVLKGNATRTCQANGTWTGSDPTCVAVSDPCASAPCQHGGVCTPDSGTGFTCSCVGTGYAGATCATPVDCGSLGTLASGMITTDPEVSTTYGTTATYECDSGYTLDGNATRTCEANGQWTGMAPTCVMQTIDPCVPNPCQNGGACNASGPATYSCVCTTGYSGTNCETPFDCGSLTAPTDGTVTAASTTLGATATYACNSNFTLVGSDTRTCEAVGWTGSAPTCEPSSCGQFTDVVYRLTGTFEIKGTSFSIGDQTFTGLTNNATTPKFASNTNTTPFVGSSTGGTFKRGFARLRFTNDASGKPIAGTVRLVEWYVPMEFRQTNGATLDANNDHSLGIIDNPGSLANCGGGDAACTNHKPTVKRACTSNASGSVTGMTLKWDACTPAWTGMNSWSYAKSARSATGKGCGTGYVQYGNNTTSSSLVPASGKGDLYQVYPQQLSKVTFSGADYLTATWTMEPIQIPNGTGQSNTWLTITNATPFGTDCGTTPAVDLVCNLE